MDSFRDTQPISVKELALYSLGCCGFSDNPIAHFAQMRSTATVYEAFGAAVLMTVVVDFGAVKLCMSRPRSCCSD